MSDWWNKEDSIPDDSNFKKIQDFYLYECPVIFKNGERVANRGLDFTTKGWNSSSLRKLLEEMKQSNNNNPISYHCCKSEEKVEIIMKQIEEENNDCCEAIVFLNRTDLCNAQTIFYCIRNGFAHSSFSVLDIGNNRLYFFESKKNGKIKGQLCLMESTLLYWIELFNKPKAFIKDKRNKKANKKIKEKFVA